MNRANLRFSESTQKHFAFLETQGFFCVQSEATFVRYESLSLFINIYHGASSYEIGLELGRLGNSDDARQPYPMFALLSLAGVPTAKEYRDYATHTPNGVDEGLGKLAKLFREHVCQNLQNATLFETLREQRQILIHNFALDVNLTQARRKLTIAWQAKDYGKVVELLHPFREVLTQSELQKLEYAARHQGKK